MKYKISRVIKSNNPEAKKWLWECWGDVRIKPAAAIVGVRKGFLKMSDATDYLHHFYFDNSIELQEILQKVKKRVTIPIEAYKGTGLQNIKQIFYSDTFFDNILKQFEEQEKKYGNSFASKKIIITEDGKKMLKIKNNDFGV